jgi:aldehyde dehydrogenase (NAD+)
MTASRIDTTRPKVTLRIGAEKRRTASGGTFDHINPCTGTPDATIPRAGPAEIDEAVTVAHDAYRNWHQTKPTERRRLLLRFAGLIEQHADDFTRLGTFDNGTPTGLVGGLVAMSVEWTRYYAGWADKITSEVSGSYRAHGEFSYTLSQPYGVIGVIITWNGPLISLAMKVPAALAAGNTVVVKPSELTPFSATLFADLAAEAGIPDGVINVAPRPAQRPSHTRWSRRSASPAARTLHEKFRSRVPNRSSRRSWSSAASPATSSSRTPTSTSPAVSAL